MGLPNPPYEDEGDPQGNWLNFGWTQPAVGGSEASIDNAAMSEEGTLAGNAIMKLAGLNRVPNFDYLLKDGVYTLFDPSGGHDGVALPAQITLENLNFTPRLPNRRGHALGQGTGGSEVFWDGENLQALGTGAAVGLNDQDQVIVQGRSTAGEMAEGFFWEHAAPTRFQDELPFWLVRQYHQIEPLCLSNQVKEAVVPQRGAAAIHVLAAAQGLDVGAHGKMLWVRDDEGKWSFANVALTEETTIPEENWGSGYLTVAFC